MSFVRAVVVAGAVLVGAACGQGDQRLVVFGASSLTDVLEQVSADFEAENPGITVVVNAAGSSTLVAQLADGAPADVLATADTATMDDAVRVGSVVDDPIVFARNEMVIAVEAGNPLGIGGVDDLDDSVVLVLAAPEVPAGGYAERVLECAGVDAEPASLEQNVRSAAAKVSLGEADAAIVYRTDVGRGLEAVEIDPACQVTADYPIASVDGSEVSRRFVDFVRGPAGVAALTAEGFGGP